MNFYMDGTAASLANLDAVNGRLISALPQKTLLILLHHKEILERLACLFFLSVDYYLRLFHCGLIQIQKKYEFSTVRRE